ncbi:MAG: type II secretion system protein [Patescibacteria group bacterium]|nr:type II secretion system protein [Patescibacteria group bacterium]
MKLKNQKGFTLIELLVVIVIIGILATLTTVALSTARVKARDAKRISDIKQMQTALELYYNEESTYPPTSAMTVGTSLVGAVSGKTFMGKIPAGPNTGETYTYAQINGGTSYTLGYILEKPVNEFAAGAAVALPGSINNQCSPNCSGKYCGDANGCGGKCASVPTLSSGSLTCNASYQLYCGTTLVTNYSMINQCSGNTPTCSGTTCTTGQVCVSNTCVSACPPIPYPTIQYCSASPVAVWTDFDCDSVQDVGECWSTVDVSLPYATMDTTLWPNTSQKQGACPSGWHTASRTEWTNLQTFINTASLKSGLNVGQFAASSFSSYTFSNLMGLNFTTTDVTMQRWESSTGRYNSGDGKYYGWVFGWTCNASGCTIEKNSGDFAGTEWYKGNYCCGNVQKCVKD